MAKDTFHGPLEPIDPCCYRIPKSYKPGMRVDGLIFANEKLMEQLKLDQAPEQVANVAFLPGIQHASIAMPDIHWGYGFCIGGVCATDPDEGGVISPGGVGYDINCLTGDARVLHRLGYSQRIDEMADRATWQLACFDLKEGRRNQTAAWHWFGQKPNSPVLRMVTEAGDDIRATADHPFWTPDGMIPVGQLKPGDAIGVSSFIGVPFEAANDDVLVSEDDFLANWRKFKLAEAGNALAQSLRFMRDNELLPLRRNAPAAAILCKILGFVFGDGAIHFDRTGKGVVSFHGKADDLEMIRADLKELGMTPSRIYRRDRHHQIQTAYREYEFDRTEEWFKVVGSSFAVLLACLGAPVGRKADQDFDAPHWLDRSPLWQRRLFLASYFGAKMTTPRTIPKHDTIFGCPTVSMNKRSTYADSGRRFMQTLSDWLTPFGIVTQSILTDSAKANRTGDATVRVRLVLSNRTESLIALWRTVGYEYNLERSSQAAKAAQYLRHKQQHVNARATAAETIREMRTQGVKRAAIIDAVSATVNQRFVERVLYGSATAEPRVAEDFQTFAQYCAQSSIGMNAGSMVWERIASIEEIRDYDGFVYDFSVHHPDHNFVANGFVVSNCGVRLCRTNLFYREVKPHLVKLIEALFKHVPTGVGRSGHYSFKGKDLTRLLGEGASFLSTRELATASDLDHTEAGGWLDGADPDEVSEHAKQRGAQQCGTLGSGNHFMEVQVVDAIFDEEAASVMGLEKDMICVMIHSGSRGLGYQVCDDALMMLRKAPEKYGIDLPDRQLACAPVNSPEGQKYIAAMRAAANFAWCNRQLLMWQAREVFADVFGRTWQSLQMNLIYDVCHNIAKFEEHTVNGVKKKVWVHRKGATRAFPPGHPEVPMLYRKIGQPVIIPGDMGRASWVLVGQQGSMDKTFGTTCHGAGRAMSRTAAIKDAAGRRIDKELLAKGIIARAQSHKGLAEEQPRAYKNVDDVVDVVHQAGLSKKVARMRPIGVIKG